MQRDGTWIEKDEDIAFHPGYYLRDEIKARGISIRDFSRMIGIREWKIRLILEGKQRVSKQTSRKIARFFGQSDMLWYNIQKTFDEKTGGEFDVYQRRVRSV